MLKQNSATPMSLSRFEAFSDAVFAIAITLLIIEVKAPDLSNATPSQAVDKLLHVWPHLLGYVTSFLVIGVIWLNHHAMFHFLKRVDRTVLILNLFLLMCVAFVPFPTALIGSYSHLQPVVIFYGFSLTGLGVAYNALWFYVVRQYVSGEGLMHQKEIQTASRWTLGYPVSYAIATALALFSTRLSIVLYTLIPLFYLFPSIIDQKAARKNTS